LVATVIDIETRLSALDAADEADEVAVGDAVIDAPCRFGEVVPLPVPGPEAGAVMLAGPEPDPGPTDGVEAGAALGTPSGAKTLCATFCMDGGRAAE
jgi:hypothetical protein